MKYHIRVYDTNFDLRYEGTSDEYNLMLDILSKEEIINCGSWTFELTNSRFEYEFKKTKRFFDRLWRRMEILFFGKSRII